MDDRMEALRIKIRESLGHAGVPLSVLAHVDEAFAQHTRADGKSKAEPVSTPAHEPAPEKKKSAPPSRKKK